MSESDVNLLLIEKLEKRIEKLEHEYKNQHKYICSLLAGNNAMHKRIAELEEKLQYVIDNYLMEFEPALTKLKELEQKLNNCITLPELEGNIEAFTERIDGMEQKLSNYTDIRKGQWREFMKLGNRINTLSAVLKEYFEKHDLPYYIDKLIHWSPEYTPEEMKPILEKIKEEQEAEPDLISNVIVECPKCGYTMKHYFKHGKQLIVEILEDLNNDKFTWGYLKSLREKWGRRKE